MTDSLTPASNVRKLLKDSIAAHKRALAARKAKQPDAMALLQRAYDLRVAAHQADPVHADLAWSEENTHTHNGPKSTHEQLMVFYLSVLPS